MISKIKYLLAPTLLLAPMLVFGANTTTTTRNLLEIVSDFKLLVARILPLIIGLALLLFLWGVLRYLLTKDEIQKAEARTFMLWGIIALFVMVSVWGFVEILSKTVFGNKGAETELKETPTLPR